MGPCLICCGTGLMNPDGSSPTKCPGTDALIPCTCQDDQYEVIELKPNPAGAKILLRSVLGGFVIQYVEIWNEGQGGGFAGPFLEYRGKVYPDKSAAIQRSVYYVRRAYEHCHHWRLTEPRFTKLTAWLKSLEGPQQTSLF